MNPLRICWRTFAISRTCLQKQNRSLFEKFEDFAFGKYLLVGNTITAGLLMIIGDIGAQIIERRQFGDVNQPLEIKAVRIGQMFLAGSVQGPVQHYFYTFLDGRWPGSTTGNIFKKLFFDQTMMSPGSIVLFFATSNVLEGKPLAHLQAELNEKFVTMYLTNFLFWPFAQYANFRYIPKKYRVVYINGLTVLYNIWLSYAKHNSITSPGSQHSSKELDNSK